MAVVGCALKVLHSERLENQVKAISPHEWYEDKNGGLLENAE